jgi:hypothetical protein
LRVRSCPVPSASASQKAAAQVAAHPAFAVREVVRVPGSAVSHRSLRIPDGTSHRPVPLTVTEGERTSKTRIREDMAQKGATPPVSLTAAQQPCSARGITYICHDTQMWGSPAVGQPPQCLDLTVTNDHLLVHVLQVHPGTVQLNANVLYSVLTPAPPKATAVPVVRRARDQPQKGAG